MTDEATEIETPAVEDPLTPPDDFGAQVLAEFERRSAATISADDGTVAQASDEDPAVPDNTGPTADEAPADADASSTVEPPEGEEVANTTTPEDEATETTEAAAETAPAGGYTWSVPDPAAEGGQRTVAFTDEEVQRSLSLAAWADGLTDDLRAQIGGIETGQAVAIPRAEYDAFQAWQAQRSASQRDADLADLDLDPDAAKLVTELRNEVAQLREQVPATAPIPGQATVDANLDAVAQGFDTAAAAYAAERGLSIDEVQMLLDDAVRANVIPGLFEAAAVVNPATGAILRPPDIGTVARQALDFGLVRNPALHERALNHVSGDSSTTPPAPATSDRVVAKKARAGSLAAAPSAAVTTPSRPAQMSQQDITAAMAKEIEAALAGSNG